MRKFYIGIDIGGTSMRGVIISAYPYRCIKKIKVATPRTKKFFLQRLNALIADLLHTKKPAGIGVGIRGSVDSQRCVLKEDDVLTFLKGWNIRTSLKKFKLPVAADNDAHCFLRSEAFAGAGHGLKNIVGLTIGTGIGGGIMIEGKMYRGAHNTAGEIGKTFIEKDATFESLSSKDAFLKLGDRSKSIGVGVANVINILDPDIVIRGGGGGLSRHVNLATVRASARKHVIASLRGKVKIVKAKLGDFGPAIGAALLFNHE